MGHYSINGTCEDHFHYEDDDPRHNHIIVDGSEQMMHYIIVHFSPPNGTILDCTKNDGMDVIFINVHILYTTVNILGCASVVAICEERNSVCIVSDTEEENNIYSLLNKLEE